MSRIVLRECAKVAPNERVRYVCARPAKVFALPDESCMPKRLRIFAFCLVATAILSPIASPAQCLRYAGVEAGGELLNLDPINQPTTQNSIMVGVVYNRLLDIDSNFEPSPELARSWEANPDATQWTFRLRDDVRWHDGTPFTAADVVYTYRRLIDPVSGSEAAATLAFLKAEGIIAVDDTTVRFELESPVSELPVLITTKNTWIVREGAEAEQLRLTPVGTGPFKPVDFDPAREPFHFERNQDYWEQGLPLSECIEFVAIQEATTMAAALMSGEIDIA